jgi:hypothetical protein
MKISYLYILCFLISCNSVPQKKINKITKKEVKEEQCVRKNDLVKDTVFSESDILASIYYDSNNKIRKAKLFVQLDERSGLIKTQNDIHNVSLTIGHVEGDSINFKHISINSGWNYSLQKKLLILDVDLTDAKLDTLSIIHLLTIVDEQRDGHIKIVQSSPYFYNSTMEYLEVENTYLDYVAFKSCAVVKKVLSKKNGFIEKVRITVKVNQNIDDIDYIEINLNKDIKLNFVCSIVAGKDIDFDFIDHDCKLESMLKMEAEYLQLDVNILKLKLQNINHLSVKLNDIKY